MSENLLIDFFKYQQKKKKTVSEVSMQPTTIPAANSIFKILTLLKLVFSVLRLQFVVLDWIIAWGVSIIFSTFQFDLMKQYQILWPKNIVLNY